MRRTGCWASWVSPREFGTNGEEEERREGVGVRTSVAGRECRPGQLRKERELADDSEKGADAHRGLEGRAAVHAPADGVERRATGELGMSDDEVQAEVQPC